MLHDFNSNYHRIPMVSNFVFLVFVIFFRKLAADEPKLGRHFGVSEILLHAKSQSR